MIILRASPDPAATAVTVTWDNGVIARFHALWLRLESTDPTTRSDINGQRLITIGDIPNDTVVERLEVINAGAALVVIFQPTGHQVRFSADWLFAHRYDKPAQPGVGWSDSLVQRWDAATMQHCIPTATFDDISNNPQALRQWLHAVRQFGFAHLSGMPIRSGQLCRVAELFGFVRETNYGRWFDVRAEVTPNNLAYTNLGLQAHTDNPYRDPVPTLQLLACLENSVVGGRSSVVDGFAVAARLLHEDPTGFGLLARHSARFEYAGSADIHLCAKRPIVELGPDHELLAVRCNYRSSAPVVDVPFDDMPDYLSADRRLAAIIDDPSMQVSFALQPGELFIVNNTRVLHSRSAFSGSGSRWLQGCYADVDGLLSTLRVLERNLDPAGKP